MKTYSDLTGRRFGKLTVVNLDKKSGNKYYWKCICDCGNEKIIRADRLLCGECVHCGCEKKVRYNRENYIGKRFGNLTVLNEVSKEYKNGEIRYFYDCICDCGFNTVEYRSHSCFNAVYYSRNPSFDCIEDI